MKSFNRQVLYTPAASGVWSNTHIDKVHSIPYETGNHYFDTSEIIDQSEDGYCDDAGRRMLETSLLYANRQSSELDLNYDTSQNFHFDNYPDRVALPFPNSENADQYKPPHQFYAAKCISQSYAFQNNRSIRSEAVPENFESESLTERQLDYSACNEDFQLQTPSSYHTSMQAPNSTPYFNYTHRSLILRAILEKLDILLFLVLLCNQMYFLLITLFQRVLLNPCTMAVKMMLHLEKMKHTHIQRVIL